LDTVEDKAIEEKTKKEDEETALPSEEPTERVEEQPTEEAETREETAATEEEEEEGKAEEALEAKAEEEIEPLAREEEAEEEVEEAEKKEKAPEEKEIVEERIYTIPLRRAWISPRKKRTPRAVRIVKSFIQRHMKIETGGKGEEEEEEEGRLVISNEVNEKLWSRGIEKPPRNIRVRAVKDKEGVVTLYLAEGD